MSKRRLDCETLLISIDGSGFWDHHLFILSVSRRSKKFGMDIRDIFGCVLDVGFFVDACYEAPSHSVGGVAVAVEVWILVSVFQLQVTVSMSWARGLISELHSDDTCTSVFSWTTTKTKIFVDENKLIFITKTTTKIRQFSSTKWKLKLKFNLMTKTTTKIWLFSSTRWKSQSRILA